MNTRDPMSPVQEFIETTGYAPRFSKVGIGGLLADVFEKKLLCQFNVFPRLPRGRTLVVCGDFGGQHRGQHFETYSFLAFDLDRNMHWLLSQSFFRTNILKSKRRMSFKGMNDIHRRNALMPLLQSAMKIEGCLITFAISKRNAYLFDSEHRSIEDNCEIMLWKPKAQERLLRILHLSTFLLSGLSAPNQDVLWITDEDDISANTNLLTQLTRLFGNISSHYLAYDLGHLRCGTTQSDDGGLFLEDCCSIPDLAAGALSEVCTGFVDQSCFPVKGLITPHPAGLTSKSQIIAAWIAQLSAPLREMTCIIEIEPHSKRTRTTTLKWQATQMS